MAFDVRLHFLFVLECVVADRTFVALGPIMLDTMQFEHMIVAKLTATNVTMVRLFAGMCARMDFQLFGACKSFATTLHLTFVWLFACDSSEYGRLLIKNH